MILVNIYTRQELLKYSIIEICDACLLDEKETHRKIRWHTNETQVRNALRNTHGSDRKVYSRYSFVLKKLETFSNLSISLDYSIAYAINYPNTSLAILLCTKKSQETL